jgi:iron transport multicopper oxidase
VANQPVGNYWIRAAPQGRNDFTNGINSAILRYKGAKWIEPSTTLLKDPNTLLETQLHALIDPAAPGQPMPDGGDVNINLNFTMNGTNWFAINNKTFEPPTVPVLLQILTGTPPHELLPNGSVYVLPRNKSISVSFPVNITNNNTNTDGPVCFLKFFLDSGKQRSYPIFLAHSTHFTCTG